MAQAISTNDGKGYFTPCRRVKAKCPKCGGGIADRGAWRVPGVKGFAPCARCRNCLELFNVGRAQAEGSA